MKKILNLVCVSALGGLLTLGGYKFFIEDQQASQNLDHNGLSTPNYVKTNQNFNLANLTATKIKEAPDFVKAVEKSIDAVVHVKNNQISRSPQSWNDLLYGRFTEREKIAGAGSGVIISPDGYIITNNHVIQGASKIGVTLNNNKNFVAELIGTDQKNDIALLKIDSDEELPFITFADSDQAKIGEWVLAVGNPFNLTSTVTAGIISAKSRDLSGGQSFIQTDAAVNPGNSGGALVNANGDLIGINTAITSQTGSYIGYSFAVPSNIAKKIVDDILEFGDVQNVILGVSILNSASEEARQLGVNEIEGVYISAVEKDTGAEKAGLKRGDIIKKIDNINITKFAELSGYLKSKTVNDVVNVEILRGDDILTIPVSLSKRESVFIDFMDLRLANIRESSKKEYPILADGGVLIVDNQNSFLYNKVGIRKGYVISEINYKPISSIDDIKKIKDEYGDNFIDELKQIEFIDRSLEKNQIIFR